MNWMYSEKLKQNTKNLVQGNNKIYHKNLKEGNKDYNEAKSIKFIMKVMTVWSFYYNAIITIDINWKRTNLATNKTLCLLIYSFKSLVNAYYLIPLLVSTWIY